MHLAPLAADVTLLASVSFVLARTVDVFVFAASSFHADPFLDPDDAGRAALWHRVVSLLSLVTTLPAFVQCLLAALSTLAPAFAARLARRNPMPHVGGLAVSGFVHVCLCMRVCMCMCLCVHVRGQMPLVLSIPHLLTHSHTHTSMCAAQLLVPSHKG